MQTAIALIDLPAECGTAFERWAEQRRIVPLVSRSPTLTPAPHLAVGLCIVGVERGSVPVDAVSLLRKQLGRPPVVVVAGLLEVDDVVRLMRSGVVDVIGLPADPREVVARASIHFRDPLEATEQGELLGLSDAMRRFRRELDAVAPLNSTVLTTGETGSGKGVAAREIHRRSRRADRAFVHVDCAMLSPSLVESDLFGHEKGAFTGAEKGRAGRFQLAEGGPR